MKKFLCAMVLVSCFVIVQSIEANECLVEDVIINHIGYDCVKYNSLLDRWEVPFNKKIKRYNPDKVNVILEDGKLVRKWRYENGKRYPRILVIEDIRYWLVSNDKYEFIECSNISIEGENYVAAIRKGGETIFRKYPRKLYKAYDENGEIR